MGDKMQNSLKIEDLKIKNTQTNITKIDTNDTENKVYETLDKLNIKYDRVDHEPVFTAEEAKECVSGLIEGVRCKNLFLQYTKKNYMKCLN